jgi:hypothetical protein
LRILAGSACGTRRTRCRTCGGSRRTRGARARG